MKVKADTGVRLLNGEQSTPRKLIAEGRATLHVSERFSASGRGAPRRAYFLDTVDGNGSVELQRATFVELGGTLPARRTYDAHNQGTAGEVDVM